MSSSANFAYSLAGHRILSNTSIEELSISEGSKVLAKDNIFYVLHESKATNELPGVNSPSQFFHSIQSPSGEPWLNLYRLEAGFLLEFCGVCCFVLSEDFSKIDCHPLSPGEEERVRHHLVDHVLPIVFSKDANLVLHASAVEIKGEVALFIGKSGAGKSTLAAGLSRIGAKFIADDFVVVEQEADRCVTRSCYPTLRLWEDSVREFFQDDLETKSSTKQRIAVENSKAEDKNIAALFVLNSQSDSQLSTKKLTAPEAYGEVLQAGFLLDIESREEARRHFELVSAFVSKIPVYSLNYPHDYRAIPSVFTEIRKVCG